MRLINTHTLQLEEFHSNIPEYAILSHIWADDEVTFEEYSYSQPAPSTNITRKAGYRKILNACSQARADGIKFCWTDTCCICKSSSAELSEAINSMFGWYKRAKICYVYLVDFDLDVPSDEQTAGFPRCRWFTRGWCLQELIAPAEISFYDASWRHIGTKTSLLQQLSLATGIDTTVLEDPDQLYLLPVARRMSWASMRETTRIEDMAYSLLGIFDINMPMLYGEGDKAFIRLQEEIIRNHNDLSIFAWGSEAEDDPTAPRYLDMLARSPRSFLSCHSLISPKSHAWALSRNQFTVTNHGIEFMNTKLVVVGRSNQLQPGFILSSQCLEAEQQRAEQYISLQMVGPGVYARTNPSRRSDNQSGDIKEESSISVLKSVTPTLLEAISTCHSHSFEIRKSDGFCRLSGWSPANAFDVSQNRFLTLSSAGFRAHLRVTVELTDLEAGFCVLALGLDIVSRSVTHTLNPWMILIEPEIWKAHDIPSRQPWVVINAAARAQRERNRHLGADPYILHLIGHVVSCRLRQRLQAGCPVYCVVVSASRR